MLNLSLFYYLCGVFTVTKHDSPKQTIDEQSLYSGGEKGVSLVPYSTYYSVRVFLLNLLSVLQEGLLKIV